MHPCFFSRVDGTAINAQLLFGYTEFSKSFRKLKCHCVFVKLSREINFQLEAYGRQLFTLDRFGHPTRKVRGLHEITDPVGISSDFLQNMKCASDSSFPG